MAKKTKTTKKPAVKENEIAVIVDEPPKKPPKVLKDYVLEAAKSPIQKQVNQALSALLVSALTGEKLDGSAMAQALESVRIGDNSLADLADKIDNLEKEINKLF